MLHNIALGIAVAMSFTNATQAQQSDSATMVYMWCVRSVAARLEPSGDEPGDIATAAVYVCAPEELNAFNQAIAEGRDYIALRETALFAATGQAVLARLCRTTGDCELAPPPDYRPAISN